MSDTAYVPVHLQPVLAAANAYLLACLAWGAAAEKLAAALQVRRNCVCGRLGASGSQSCQRVGLTGLFAPTCRLAPPGHSRLPLHMRALTVGGER
jgi:hypothetical protein